MFTGLIEVVCSVKSVRSRSAGLVLQIEAPRLADDIKIGESIAVNGACLTVTEVGAGLISFDISGQTLQKTNLGQLRTGSKVNIERALKADGRFGGHIVQGHVDGVARIKAILVKGGFWDIRFVADQQIVSYMLPQGSVAVDGISLTVADMGKDWFSAVIIPATLENTTLGSAKVSDKVNIEADIISKLVRLRLGEILPAGQPLTSEKLRKMGFV